MKSKIKNFIFRAIMGALTYMGIEVAWDNTSHRSMGLLGSVSFLIAHWLPSEWSMRKRSFWLANIITLLEYVGGRIFNHDYSIWDYRHLPLNIDGYVCIPFWLIWFFGISPLAFWLDDKLEDENIDIFEYYKELWKR